MIYKKFIILCFCMFLFFACSKRDPRGVLSKTFLGHKVQSIKSFQNEKTKGHFLNIELDFERGFPKKFVSEQLRNQKLIIIDWLPWIWKDPNSIKMSAILQGEWDGYLKDFAQEAKEFEYSVVINFAPLFNTEKEYPWTIKNLNKNPEQYTDLYRYIVNLFREVGANNVYFMWTPSVKMLPLASWNEYINAYPGDDYVDIVAADLEYLFNTESDYELLRNLYVTYPKKPLFSFFSNSFNEKILVSKLSNEYRFLRGIIFRNNYEFKTEHDVFQSSIDDFQSIVEALKNHEGFSAETYDFKEKKNKLLPMWNMTQGSEKVTHNKDFNVSYKMAIKNNNLDLTLEIVDDIRSTHKFSHNFIENGESFELILSDISKLELSDFSVIYDADFHIGLSLAKDQKRMTVWNYNTFTLMDNIISKITEKENKYILNLLIPLELISKDMNLKNYKFVFAVRDQDDGNTIDTEIVSNGDRKFRYDPRFWNSLAF